MLLLEKLLASVMISVNFEISYEVWGLAPVVKQSITIANFYEGSFSNDNI